MSPNDANPMFGNYFFKAVLQEAFRKFKLSADVKKFPEVTADNTFA